MGSMSLLGWKLWPVVAAVLLALALKKADCFWNSGRSIPLGTFWQVPGFALSDMPDLTGKTALVTGANTGIGRATALQLVLANASVIFTCRDLQKCRAAVSEVSAEVAATGGVGSARAVQLDLLDLKQVDAVATSLFSELSALHILVNNAGIATKFPHTISGDGVEATFQANYLGHFWLTKRLLPLLEQSAPAHVVHLTSGAHRGAPTEGVLLSRDGINDQTAIGPYARYGMAKLASLVFAKELHRRSSASGVVSNSVHPGVVATSMLRDDNFAAMLGPTLGPLALAVARLRNRLFAYSADTAALSLLHCATNSKLRQTPGGELFVPVATRWQARHPKAHDVEFATALWTFSEELVASALK